ncbi:geranylgeranyltransferase type II [Fimicolochytrium jonesii]|uniref:geranylgeranyltransferase type II n=1 Tax=Fimicolochytrium jonesii TaxID=1396493 RepID=UPI0022FF445B|nr:geranylgeranyltransferase type II [Fimicolochytrium jonesii]KAI8816880.1 geranylgeranyltransferase type II [Fimicolochytrium jonesii]
MSAGQHHQRKSKISEEVLEAQREKSRKKLGEYRKLTDALSKKRRDDIYDNEAFDLTTKILAMCPEYYTMWNYRRKIMLDRRKTLSDEAYQSLCLSELKLADEALKANPKSYWVWNHRRWLLENMPEPTWARELKLLGGLLDMDARNFHGWGHRRYVIAASHARTPLEEFNYTSEKIAQNFSNYSAWHYRSKVLLLAFDDEKEREGVLDKEFELVRNAIYTEPADQSAWLYQRWLLSLVENDTTRWESELQSVRELVDLEPDSKWALLTMVHMLTKLSNPESLTEAREILQRLEVIDPDRREYHRDLARALS